MALTPKNLRQEAARLRKLAMGEAARIVAEAESRAATLEKLADQYELEGHKTVVAKSSMRQDRSVTSLETRRRQAEGGRKRRKNPTRVHAAADAIGWPLGRLAEELALDLRRPISRASVQFWAVGERVLVGADGSKRTIQVAAPQDVREAAERLTKGALKATDWPGQGS